MPDIDFCTTCVSSPDVRKKHDTTHSFWPIIEPRNKTEYDIARKAILEQKNSGRSSSVTHPYTTCDVCQAASIGGIRFKCLECPGMPNAAYSRSRPYVQLQIMIYARSACGLRLPCPLILLMLSSLSITLSILRRTGVLGSSVLR